MKATVYLEHNNGGKIILFHYRGNWYAAEPECNGYYGEVDIYATIHTDDEWDDEPASDEIIAARLAQQFEEWGAIDSDFFDEAEPIAEYAGLEIDDIDEMVNYTDGMPNGHDTTDWTKIGEFRVE